jgi:alpha(1,3/1,4) fucosyltransferase
MRELQHNLDLVVLEALLRNGRKMKKIKVWFLDYGEKVPEDFILYEILKKNYIVELDKNPDYLIFSDPSYEFLNFDCIRIHYSLEQKAPDFDLIDYEMGYDDLSFGDRYIRFPYYQLVNLGEDSFFYHYVNLQKRKKMSFSDFQGREFCSYLTSNPNQLSSRDKLVSIISTYKEISSGGRYNNNVGYVVDDKLDFLRKFKFTVAAENANYKGYTTEKIFDAFITNTIPIYLGNPDIDLEFNPGSFINVNSFESFELALEFIKEVDRSESLYMDMINQPKILDESIINSYDDLENFIKSIFNQPLETARRRPKSQFSRHKANQLYFGSKLVKFYSSIPLFLKSIVRHYTRRKVK